MLRKIILPLVLLIFTQQNFYGMEEEEKNTNDVNTQEIYEIKQQNNKWWEFLEPKFEKDQCLRYHIRALFNNFFRKWCGAYKRVELSYGEFFYGSVSGIGWYPQFLNFHDHFRMGFFELSYNSVATLFRIIRAFFTKKKENDFSLENIVLHFIGGFNFSIINFKIYNNLIRFNFINILLLILVYRKIRDKYSYIFYNEGESIKIYNSILFFGKNLPDLEDCFYCKKYRINHYLLILNLILPEIYFDFSFFDSRDKEQGNSR